MSHVATAEHGVHAAGHHEEELSFWRKYVFAVDHKVIGLQYMMTALLFLFFGFTLMMLMRWQLAFPGKPVPAIPFVGLPAFIGVLLLFVSGFNRYLTMLVGVLFLGIAGLVWYLTSDENLMPGGIMLPEFYNSFGAMHGTIMVFLWVVPLAVGAFGNYVVPLQIGAPDMAFPKLNAASYWSFFLGGVVMISSFFAPGSAANSGWTSYPPLSDIATVGQTYWLFGMVFLITSSLLGSVNFITTDRKSVV